MKNQFKNTIGHERQKRLFLEAYEKGRLGHAYALIGPAGIGKTTFARDFAAVLGAHPVLDIFSYDSDKFTIEQARQLRGNIRLRSSSGGWRAGIISGAEKMTLAAANSLLKILEEPPANSIIFLTAESYHNLLPTIASRVQRVGFSRLSDTEMREVIKGGFQGDPETLLEIADARPGAAIRLAMQPELLDFYKYAKQYYQTMEKGSLTERMLASQALSKFESAELAEYLIFAMREWFKKGAVPELGQKIMTAFSDQMANLITKLLLDNLFI